MPGSGFNPFDYAAELKKIGVPPEQADLQARALSQLQDATGATKQDLELAKLDLKRDIESLRVEVQRDVQSLRAEVKRDIQSLRAEVQRDIQSLRVELQRDIQSMGYKLTIKMGLLYSGIFGIILAMAKMGLLSIR